MTQIEVPDWVVEQAAYAIHRVMKGSSLTDSDWTNGSILGRDNEWRKQVTDAATSAITAALGAWVVPVGYENRWHCTGNKWLSRDPAHPDDGDSQPAYVLRQEKPE